MIALALLLAGCGSDADRSRLPAIPDPPVVPPLEDVADRGESRAFDLDFGGGGSGAPYGTNLFVPPGATGSVSVGPLSDGSKGARLDIPSPGDTVLCSSPVRLVGPVEISARLRVEALTASGGAWSGVDLEVRARDAEGKLLSPEGARFHRLRHWGAAGEWEEWTEAFTPPPGAVKGEVCLRLVGATGVVELDRLAVIAPGVPLPPPVPIVSLAWDLDTPGGGSGAPQGLDFLIPPGTTGATLTHGPVGDGRVGVRIAVDTPGNAVACTQGFSVAPGMLAKGTLKLESVTADDRPWTGFVVEVRTYDLVGGLISPAGTPFTPVVTLRAPGDWATFAHPFAPPADAVTGKLCFRFVEATGVALLDDVAVGE